MNYRKIIPIFIIVLAMLAVGCRPIIEIKNDGDAESSSITPILTPNLSDEGKTDKTKAEIAEMEKIEFPDEAKSGVAEKADCVIILDDENTSINGNGAAYSNGIVTIAKSGKYLITGKMSDGQIIVDSSDSEKTELLLNGAWIHCETGAAIYVKNSEASKTTVELCDKSVNILTDGTEHILEENSDEPDATLFSKDDLKISGSGTLYIAGNYSKGVHSKDDLELENATVYILSVDNGFRGKDSVEITSGTLVIESGADGIRTNNTEDDGKGYISISGGHIEITSAFDAVQAVTDLMITGGELVIQSGGGSVNSSSNQNSDWGNWGGGFGGGPGGGMMPPGGFGGGMHGGRGERNAPNADEGFSEAASFTQTAQTTSDSAKGLKADGDITIAGGVISIDSSDDSIHGVNIEIKNGTMMLTSGDDGIHADTAAKISGGDITVTKSYEGIEGADIVISGGVMNVTSSDDGLNGAGGKDSSSTTNRPGAGMFSSSTGTLTVSGGKIIVDASGDGIDINGSITMTGGSVTVYGSTNNGNGALDYDKSFLISGGELFAFGSTGMAQGVSASSEQNSIFVGVSVDGGKLLEVTDGNGVNIVTITPPKAYSCVLISTPQIEHGMAYTFHLDGEKIGTITAE